ncbi:unnamed protein product [Calypogeia fissa]
MRVRRSTFYYICSMVAPIMEKSKKGGGIPLTNRVALALNRLATGNYLLGCADLYGVSEGLASIIVCDFCRAILKFIRPLVVPRLTKAALPRIAAKFEEKHGIPFIMGAIDGSHIPIIAPRGDPGPFYNRKGFYSVLLQGIVDVETVFMDWDFGWAGSLHDYTMFVNSWEGRKITAREYLPFKLIGDAAYPCRTSMYVPFKGSKEQLDPKDFWDEGLVEEAKKWLHLQNIQAFGDLKQVGTQKIYSYAKAEINRLEVDVNGLVQKATEPIDDEEEAVVRLADQSESQALEARVIMHTHLAQSLFEQHLQ